MGIRLQASVFRLRDTVLCELLVRRFIVTNMTNDERVLWTSGDVQCVMVSCCAGAELQLRQRQEIILRELYPTKTDLYERSNEIKLEYPKPGA